MKIALIGTGKMGQAIASLAQNSGHEIVVSIGGENKHLLSAHVLRQADVAIEFTRPEAAPANLRLCLSAGIPVVCGTTGWQPEFESIRNEFMAQGGSLVAASNFSVGVNLLFQLNEQLASWMQRHPGYTPRIEETHHTQKLDAPSGTAITLADGILQYRSELRGWKLEDQDQPAASDRLPIQAHREGQVIGLHTVTWNSSIDSLRITHEAYNRNGFAEGALLAAAWISGKKGVFSMKDVLFGEQASG